MLDQPNGSDFDSELHERFVAITLEGHLPVVIPGEPPVLLNGNPEGNANSWMYSENPGRRACLAIAIAMSNDDPLDSDD